MTERRFLIDASLEPGATVALGEGSIRHAHVLRLGPGDSIVLFDGRGAEAEAVLVSETQARIVTLRRASEPWRVVLLAGLPRGPALDALLRGATEAGASELRIFPAARSSGPHDLSRASQRLDRGRRIIDEAARQSERAILPPLLLCPTLQSALESRPEAAALLALDARRGEELTVALGEVSGRELWLVIGPEGGLDDAELACLERAGGRCVRAALPVLRVETAASVLTALAVLSAAQNR